MIITTILLVIVMLLVWRVSIWLIIPFCLVFGIIEFVYLSSVLYKFKEGGYLPIVIATFLVIMMGVWHYVHVKKYWYELEHIVTNEAMKQLIQTHDVKDSWSRLPLYRTSPGNLAHISPPHRENPLCAFSTNVCFDQTPSNPSCGSLGALPLQKC